jgi:hypothetical protein
MSRRMRAYYYAVLGAIGGLFGWQASNVLGLSFTPSLVVSEAVVGGMIGLSIGLWIGACEGLMARNLARAGRAGLFSGVLGLAAGAIGLPLGEWFFQAVGAGLVGRILGWALFGLIVGSAEGVTGGTQLWKGALGGLLGGTLGGALLEGVGRWLEDPLTAKGIGLTLVGASVGAFLALMVVWLSRAWLEVASGKLKGTEFILDKFLPARGPNALLGSDALKADVVLPDPDVAPQHALLTGAGTHFLVKDLSTQGTFIDGQRIEESRISDGQRIRIGNTELVYHERR